MEKLPNIIVSVFEEREDHQEFDTPQRIERYTGRDANIAKNTFKNIRNGQLHIFGENTNRNMKIVICKKNNEIFID